MAFTIGLLGSMIQSRGSDLSLIAKVDEGWALPTISKSLLNKDIG
jgi:hypothetical protein